MTIRIIPYALPLMIVLATATWGGTVAIEASRDATLIEDTAGSLANGSGPHLFAGRTSQSKGSVRRAVLAFDVAGHVPSGATITEAALSLHMCQTNAGPETVSLHPLQAAWSEGPSSASGGSGAPAEPGDVTWIHYLFEVGLWGGSGADFVASSSSVVVDGPDDYTWSGTPAMIDDVQRWLDQPSENHGWLLRGDEAAGSTVKRFDSREHRDPALRPRLVVFFVETDDEDEDHDEYDDE